MHELGRLRKYYLLEVTSKACLGKPLMGKGGGSLLLSYGEVWGLVDGQERARMEAFLKDVINKVIWTNNASGHDKLEGLSYTLSIIQATLNWVDNVKDVLHGTSSSSVNPRSI
jgi:hypothetical protein